MFILKPITEKVMKTVMTKLRSLSAFTFILLFSDGHWEDSISLMGNLWTYIEGYICLKKFA